MRSLIILLILGALFLIDDKSIAQAVSKVPSPNWIKKQQIDLTINESKLPTGSSYYLLIDRQINLKVNTSYYHFAYKILSHDGVQEMADLSFEFNPEFQGLSIHNITVHRGNSSIDKLKTAEIKTIQREQSMDRYLYDGSQTAIINLTDIRVGDIVEYDYSIQGVNPVFEGHYSEYFYFDYSSPYGKLFQRLIAPLNATLYLHYGNGAVTPHIQTYQNAKEYTWLLNDVDAVIADNNAPSWYDPYRYVVITDFKDWKGVVDWAEKQFSTQDIQMNTLKKKVPKDFFEGATEEKIGKAIRFVQDEVRYLGFENGVHSHKPHDPVQVFDQRFGDCKDKSLLLSSIIKLQGYEAYPVLVSTSMRDHIASEPPTLGIFNHCVVEVIYDGKSIFIDPTINNQGGSLSSTYFPTYSKGLIIKKGNEHLNNLEANSLGETVEEQYFELAEIGGGASLKIRTTYAGVEADVQRSEFGSKDIETIQKSYLSFYGNLYPDITVSDKIKIIDSREENVLTIEEFYSIPTFWKPNPDVENQIYCELYPQSIENFLNVSKLTNRKAPYKITYPLSYKHITKVKLPEPWSIEPDEKDIESEYYSYSHSISYEDEEITINHHYRTKKEEIPIEYTSQFVEDHQVMRNNLSYYLTHIKNGPSQSALGEWYPLMISLLAMAIGVFTVIRLNKFDPPAKSVEQYPLPIGGWLILVAIGVSLTPLRIVYDLLNEENNFYNSSVWTSLWQSNQLGIFAFLTVELMYNITFLFFSVLVIVLFFQRRSSLPILISFFYGLSFGITLVDMLVASYVVDVSFKDNLTDILQPLLVAVIWIPYFNYSERVEETFICRAN